MTGLSDHGIEWIVDATGCAPEPLTDRELLQGLLAAIVRDLGLHPVGAAHWHRFPETRGLTGFWLLAESHLSCHTFPEFGGACFDLFCCGPRPDWPWEERLRSVLRARRVSVRTLAREWRAGEETP